MEQDYYACCIESLPYFWMYENKSINKKKKKKWDKFYTHTAKLSNLCLRLARMISQKWELSFNHKQWTIRINKYNSDYDTMGDKDIDIDKDFTIPDLPFPIMQKWFTMLKAKVKICQDIDTKIFINNRRTKMQ